MWVALCLRLYKQMLKIHDGKKSYVRRLRLQKVGAPHMGYSTSDRARHCGLSNAWYRASVKYTRIAENE